MNVTIEQGKSLGGIIIVKYIVDLLMRIPPKEFDKKRFAPIVSFVVAVGGSIIESLISGSMDLPSAFLRGVMISIGASGWHSVSKNYKQLANGEGGE